MTEQIDFVVLWVDGTDPDWQKERAYYILKEKDNGSTSNRYRNWELMQYWFRGVEQFASWVHRVFFVTNGQIPKWLNVKHPKLRIVLHEEYIPKQFLPTFNSNVIELWLHRIPDLGEQFVLFNDDMFLTAPVCPEDFFQKRMPCDSALMDIATAPHPKDCFPHMMINNIAVINQHFRKKEVIKRNLHKFYTLRYGVDLLRNVCLAPFRYFSCFRDSHLPSSYLKSTFVKVWQEEGEILERCSQNRFRSKTDVTHWLMKCWQICEGNFVARSTGWGHHFELWEDDVEQICHCLETKKYRAVCLNDSKEEIDFEEIRKKLKDSFERLFPEPSLYEETGVRGKTYEIGD